MNNEDRSFPLKYRGSRPPCLFHYVCLVSGTFACILCVLLLLAKQKNSDSLTASCTNKEECNKNKPTFEKLTSNCSQVCTTRQCIDAASKMMQRMDFTAEPCEDLHRFACGRFPEDHYLFQTGKPALVFEESLFTLYKDLYEMINNISAEYAEANPDSLSSKSKIIYDSCVRSMFDIERELKNLVQWISTRAIPGWPNLEPESKLTDDDLNSWLVNSMLVQDFPFYKIYFTFSSLELLQKYMDKFDVTIPPDFQLGLKINVLLNHEDYHIAGCESNEDDKELNAFLKQIMQHFDVLPGKNASELIDDAFRLHKEWHFARMEDEEMNETATASKNETGGQDMEDPSPCSEEEHRNLSRWCDLLFRIVAATGSDIDLTTAHTTVRYSRTIQKVEKYLRTQSKKSIANYLAVRLLHKTLSLLQTITTIDMPCPNLNIINEEMKRSSDSRFHCIVCMNEFVPTLLAKNYLIKANAEEKIIPINAMLEHIKQIGSSLANDSEWMSDGLKGNVLRVIKNTYVDTSDYVSYVLKTNHIENLMSEMNLVADNFVHNYFEMRKLHVLDDVKYYRLGNQWYDFERVYFAMNAIAGERMLVGFGYFQHPATDIGRPKYFDYAMHGGMLAHEVVHNIHEEWGQYSRHVKQESEVKFIEEHKTCLVDAYSTFKIPEINAPGRNTTYDENLADVTGFRIADKAYRDYLEKHGPEDRIPGWSFTNIQIFYIALAQVWCEFGDAEIFKMYVKNNHSPGRMRILVPMMQSKEFSEAFNCSKDSFMNPVDKCGLLL